ncbi:ABC transporter ATP-binding protein [Acidisoma cellulosilytica]|uniref:ABC transporter ATP-binding protein n=1 Tax=Acidisoma cellulosilyticum TaxID=2802395 RepID=A0A963Z403_9PROT|nr:ABC transporter ATP-binding protein [Acidisoma cellulosilyticum]MCB8881333.1 ABC transporter ATP-binding protein [Acidisoma cellulosilyticum]
MSTLLEIRGIETGYGRIKILHDVTLDNASGNIGLFGPNGHGKTTLLRCVSGLLRAWHGEIRFDGQVITNLPPRRIVERGLIHVSQGNRLFPDLTIRETLRLGAFPRRARAQEAQNIERVAALFPKLRERWSQRVRTLSGGERQMVSIAVALMSEPRLLILDEPTLGLAPRIKDELCDAIKLISQAGVKLVVVEQDVEFLLDLADHLYLINHGEVAAEVRPGDSMNHEAIMEMYFGRQTSALT